MEQYFEEIASQMEGYEDFRNDAWRFKVSCHPKPLRPIPQAHT